MVSSNKFWGFVFIVGVFTLSILLYAFFSTSNDKIEASTVQETSNGDLVVVVDDKGFKPRTTEAGVGTSVKWVNRGAGVHSVTFGVNTSLENLTHIDQALKPSETLTFKFEKSGSFNYYDKKSGFTGVINVK